jgi:hypothetical protein
MLKPKVLIKKEIFCRFTGEKTGEISYSPDKFPPGYTPTLGDLGVVDARCDVCEEDFGNYKEMELEAAKLGVKGNSFKALIRRAGYKKGPFQAELAKERAKKQD